MAIAEGLANTSVPRVLIIEVIRRIDRNDQAPAHLSMIVSRLGRTYDDRIFRIWSALLYRFYSTCDG